jgi:hypothetical protein
MMPLFAQGDLPTLSLDPATIRLLAWAIGGYVLFLLAISIYATGKVKDEADYVVAGRRLPLFLAWGTLIATWFGAAAMFAAAGAAREEGLLGVVLDPFACAGTLVLAGVFFARPLWRMELYTMADFYRVKYGKAAEIVGACIQVPTSPGSRCSTSRSRGFWSSTSASRWSSASCSWPPSRSSTRSSAACGR